MDSYYRRACLLKLTLINVYKFVPNYAQIHNLLCSVHILGHNYIYIFIYK
jgi:hypothetical protein